MDLKEALEARHAVRDYKSQKIEGDVLSELKTFIDKCNKKSGLNIQLCIDEPSAFSGLFARNFTNVSNYIALIGKDDNSLEEKCGYYGEQIVLKAQQLGLNTCWAGMASKGKAKKNLKINQGEKLVISIAVGYGKEQGVLHESKPLEELYTASGDAPKWFINGVKAAQLAPSALRQYKFHFELIGEDKVKAESGKGIMTKVDVGIAKYHFEIGAEGKEWSWV